MASRNERSKQEIYPLLVGRLLGNFQGLEFAIRAFLYARADGNHAPLQTGTNLNTLRVGDIAPENAMTCYDSLGTLIARYNKIAPAPLQIDESIVDIRDALAHGRVSSFSPTDHFHLLKFSKAFKRRVHVTFSQEMSEAWLRQQVSRIASEFRKVGRNSELQPEEGGQAPATPS